MRIYIVNFLLRICNFLTRKGNVWIRKTPDNKYIFFGTEMSKGNNVVYIWMRNSEELRTIIREKVL